MLNINPKMLSRLAEIEDDLVGRRERAEREAWLGEIEGIDLTLSFLRQKHSETKRLARLAPAGPTMITLGPPLPRQAERRCLHGKSQRMTCPIQGVDAQISRFSPAGPATEPRCP